MSTIETRRIAGALGAELTGIDLSRPLDAGIIDALHAALCAHQVLFFRDQELPPASHRALARAFGEPQPHPSFPTIEGYPELSILDVNPEAPPKIDTWHTDMTFMECPPLGSILKGVIVPPVGGDTLFASATAAFEALSLRMQRYLDGLTAVHSFAHGFRHSLAEPGGAERLAGVVAKHPPVEHPVVRTHPVTGAKVLFVNALFTTHIAGMKEAESDAVLSFLYRHQRTEEFICRFAWRPGSVAFWDNRATQHRPVNDFWPASRQLHRITIRGDRPV